MSGTRKLFSILLAAVIVGALAFFYVTTPDDKACDTSQPEKPTTNYNVEVTYTPEDGSKMSIYQGCGEWSQVSDDRILVIEGDELNPEFKIHLSEDEYLVSGMVYYGDGSSAAAWAHPWDGHDQVTPKRSFRINKELKVRVKLGSIHLLIHRSGEPFPAATPGKGLCDARVFNCG